MAYRIAAISVTLSVIGGYFRRFQMRSDKILTDKVLPDPCAIAERVV